MLNFNFSDTTNNISLCIFTHNLNALNAIKLFKLCHSVYIMYQSHSDVCNKNILLRKIMLTLSFIVHIKNHSIACFIIIHLCNGNVRNKIH